MSKKVKVEYVLIGQSLTFETDFDPNFLCKCEKAIRRGGSMRVTQDHKSYSVNPRNVLYVTMENKIKGAVR